MKLNTVKPTPRVEHRRNRRVGSLRCDTEARRRGLYEIAVAHPDWCLLRNSFKEQVVLTDMQKGTPVLPPYTLANRSAEHMSHELHAVTDTQDRHLSRKDLSVTPGSALHVDARRPS